MQKALYDTYAPRLMVVCLRYADSDEAQDILQESMVKAFKGLENFRGESHLYYWLKRITVNTALNSLRGKINMLTVSGKEAQAIEKDWDAIDEFEHGELIEMIQSLPSGCRTVFNLYVIEGFKHEEIAEQLGVTVGTSKSQLSRAKQLLQEKLKREELRSHG